jgi:hypothetical protein
MCVGGKVSRVWQFLDGFWDGDYCLGVAWDDGWEVRRGVSHGLTARSGKICLPRCAGRCIYLTMMRNG